MATICQRLKIWVSARLLKRFTCTRKEHQASYAFKHTQNGSPKSSVSTVSFFFLFFFFPPSYCCSSFFSYSCLFIFWFLILSCTCLFLFLFFFLFPLLIGFEIADVNQIDAYHRGPILRSWKPVPNSVIVKPNDLHCVAILLQHKETKQVHRINKMHSPNHPTKPYSIDPAELINPPDEFFSMANADTNQTLPEQIDIYENDIVVILRFEIFLSALRLVASWTMGSSPTTLLNFSSQLVSFLLLMLVEFKICHIRQSLLASGPPTIIIPRSSLTKLLFARFLIQSILILSFE